MSRNLGPDDLQLVIIRGGVVFPMELCHAACHAACALTTVPSAEDPSEVCDWRLASLWGPTLGVCIPHSCGLGSSTKQNPEPSGAVLEVLSEVTGLVSTTRPLLRLAASYCQLEHASRSLTSKSSLTEVNRDIADFGIMGELGIWPQGLAEAQGDPCYPACLG